MSAQRLIYGFLAVFLVLIYVTEMIYLQCSWSTFSLSAGFSGTALEMLLNGAKRALLAAVIPIVFSVFTLPIIFSSLTELGFNKFWASLISMLGVQVIITVPNWLLQLGSGSLRSGFPGNSWRSSLSISGWEYFSEPT